MMWRSRFAGLTEYEMDRITVVLGLVLAWAWADCLATSVVPPCRTQSNVVPKQKNYLHVAPFFSSSALVQYYTPELSREPTLQHLLRS